MSKCRRKRPPLAVCSGRSGLGPCKVGTVTCKPVWIHARLTYDPSLAFSWLFLLMDTVGGWKGRHEHGIGYRRLGTVGFLVDRDSFRSQKNVGN
jgi:hypothetical protein